MQDIKKRLDLEVSKRDRVDDAIGATRAAIEDGIVTGGSVSYIKIAVMIDPIINIIIR